MHKNVWRRAVPGPAGELTALPLSYQLLREGLGKEGRGREEGKEEVWPGKGIGEGRVGIGKEEKGGLRDDCCRPTFQTVSAPMIEM